MNISKSMLKSFWLFLLVILIMVANGLPAWLVGLLAVVILGAPLLREFKKGTDLDERQIALSHFSSHLAFFVLLALIVLVMIVEFIAQGKNPDPQWYMLLIVPLVIKLLISLFQNYGTVPTAQWIGYFFAGIWLLFVLLSHGLSLESLIEAIPFIIILAVAWFSRKYPLAGGLAFVLLAIGLLFFFRAWWNLDVYVRILMYTLIPLPLLISGVALLIHSMDKKKAEV